MWSRMCHRVRVCAMLRMKVKRGTFKFAVRLQVRGHYSGILHFKFPARVQTVRTVTSSSGPSVLRGSLKTGAGEQIGMFQGGAEDTSSTRRCHAVITRRGWFHQVFRRRLDSIRSIDTLGRRRCRRHRWRSLGPGKTTPRTHHTGLTFTLGRAVVNLLEPPGYPLGVSMT